MTEAIQDLEEQVMGTSGPIGGEMSALDPKIGNVRGLKTAVRHQTLDATRLAEPTSSNSAESNGASKQRGTFQTQRR